MYKSWDENSSMRVENPLHIWANTCPEADEDDEDHLFEVFISVDTSKLSLKEESAFEHDLEDACAYSDNYFESVTITPIECPECAPEDPGTDEWIYGCYEIRGELTQWTIDNIFDVFCKYDVEYSEKIKG